MSLKIDEVIETLKEQKLAADILIKVETALEKLEAEKKEDRADNKLPKSKNEFVIVVRGDAQLRSVLQQGWVMTAREGVDVAKMPDLIKQSVKDNNARQKRKKRPIDTLRDFFLRCKRNVLKEKNIAIKTKEAVQVIVMTEENV